MLPKPRLRPCVDHITHVPRLPVDLPPRAPSVGPNAQLQRLERHQQQLQEIERRHEQQSRRAERRDEEKKHLEEEQEGEEQEGRDLLQQQQEELKQRQQILQWQQELEQQNKQHKTLTTALLSPSGLGTIYEALESSDAEEDCQDDRKMEEMVECEPSSKDLDSSMETDASPPKNTASPQSHNAAPSPKPIQDQAQIPPPVALDQPPLSPSHPQQLTCTPELDWGKKVDIVQQLINQTLLLAGDGCPPLLLTSAGGTLSPLETSLWPDLLPPVTPPSATVTCVSSFSPEASGNSPQGEWTVVEVETHH